MTHRRIYFPSWQLDASLSCMDENDPSEAAGQADDALAAYRASSRPPLPLPAALVSAVAAGTGIALLGQPFQGLPRAGFLALAIALLLIAGAIPTVIRHRSGLHGYRGQVRRDNVVLTICTVALLVIGLTATPTLGVIYVGLGVVAAVTWFLTLRTRFGAPAGLPHG